MPSRCLPSCNRASLTNRRNATGRSKNWRELVWLAAQNTILVWLAGVFAALSALITGLVYAFCKGSEFTFPRRAGHDGSRRSLGCLGARRHHPPPSTPFIARLVSCA